MRGHNVPPGIVCFTSYCGRRRAGGGLWWRPRPNQPGSVTASSISSLDNSQNLIGVRGSAPPWSFGSPPQPWSFGPAVFGIFRSVLADRLYFESISTMSEPIPGKESSRR